MRAQSAFPSKNAEHTHQELLRTLSEHTSQELVRALSNEHTRQGTNA